MTTDYEQAARIYGAQRVFTSTPVDIFLLLVERCLTDLDRAARAREEGDPVGGRTLARHAHEIVFALLSGLDRERGGQLAERLAALYVFAIGRTGPGASSTDLRAARSVLAPIAEAYRMLRSGAARVG
jgi:flagellar biosynthetic protein FliS